MLSIAIICITEVSKWPVVLFWTTRSYFDSAGLSDLLFNSKCESFGLSVLFCLLFTISFVSGLMTDISDFDAFFIETNMSMI